MGGCANLRWGGCVGVQISDGVDVWVGRCANQRWGGRVGG